MACALSDICDNGVIVDVSTMTWPRVGRMTRTRAEGHAGRKPIMKQPTENQEQIALVAWLRARPHVPLFFHVPNQRKCSAREGELLKKLGERRGVPDLMIATPPPAVPGKHGAFVEMKRRDGGVRRPEQIAWERALLGAGWEGGFCEGAAEAVQMLKRLGY